MQKNRLMLTENNTVKTGKDEHKWRESLGEWRVNKCRTVSESLVFRPHAQHTLQEAAPPAELQINTLLQRQQHQPGTEAPVKTSTSHWACTRLLL